jgi:hypothetical protein
MSLMTTIDQAGGVWKADDHPGPIRIGSEAHKILFSRMLLETFDPYRPAVLDWPKLSPDALHRLTSLPIWDIAVQTEAKASLRVKTYAEMLPDDGYLKRAVELNAFEEGRHKQVLSNLVEAYGLKIAPEPEYKRPRDVEWAFMVTGFSECIDSFFAFGLFELAKRSGYFPTELVETFEPVIREEGRHILFFVNWVAWYRRNMPIWRRPWFELRVMAVWLFLAWERVGMAKDIDGAPAPDNNFTLTGARDLGVNVGVAELMDICLSENDRRLGLYDRRLLRPTFVPSMVRLARRFLRAPKSAVA